MKYDIDSINRRKKRMQVLKKILSIFIIIFIYNIILIFISLENVSTGIGIFGYRAYIISSNSMEPTISLGDVVITKSYKKEKIYTGDVITFKQDGEVITHRILKIEDTNEGTVYTTKGDNNNIEDTEQITYSQIQGKSILTIPYLGKIILMLNNKIIVLIIIQKIEEEKRSIKKNY